MDILSFKWFIASRQQARNTVQKVPADPLFSTFYLSVSPRAIWYPALPTILILLCLHPLPLTGRTDLNEQQVYEEEEDYANDENITVQGNQGPLAFKGLHLYLQSHGWSSSDVLEQRPTQNQAKIIRALQGSGWCYIDQNLSYLLTFMFKRNSCPICQEATICSIWQCWPCLSILNSLYSRVFRTPWITQGPARIAALLLPAILSIHNGFALPGPCFTFQECLLSGEQHLDVHVLSIFSHFIPQKGKTLGNLQSLRDISRQNFII